MAEVVRVRVNIEPRWTSDHHSEVIEIEAERLAGMDDDQRSQAIFEAAEDYVNDECSWGFQVLGPEEE